MTTATKIPVDSIKIPVTFVELCDTWYGGQDCMLYAVCSTRNLTTGTHRPRGCDSDEQWYLTIWRELSCDVGRAESIARRDGDEDWPVLAGFEAYVDAVVERLAQSYGLEEWEPEV